MAGTGYDITTLERPVVVPERVAAAMPSHTSVCSAGGAHHYRLASPGGGKNIGGTCIKCEESREWKSDPLDGRGTFDDLRLPGTRFETER